MLARHMPPLAKPQFFWAVGGILVLVSVLCGLGFRIFQLLKKIVDTVSEGDPFIPDNAARLTLMAWLVLAGQIVGLPIATIAAWINKAAEGWGHTDINVVVGFAENGLLLLLLLFILARVFRKGAEMRAELEGTV